MEHKDDSVNQIKCNGTHNPYRSNYRGRGGQGRGAPMVHHMDVEVTMVTMEMVMEANRKETTKCRMVPNQPAGTATSMDIVKKTVESASGRMLPAKVSIDQPTGQNKKHHLLEEMKNMKLKELLEKCTQENWPQYFQVFSKGRSYVTDLHPKDFFQGF